MFFTRVALGLVFALAVLALGGLFSAEAFGSADDQLRKIGEEEKEVGDAISEAMEEDLEKVEKKVEDLIHGKHADDAHDGAHEADAGGHGAHGHGEVNEDPLEFKKDLALWTGVIFVVLVIVLYKFAWGPICEGLEKREKGIADHIEGAEKANKEAQELLGTYQQQLADAKSEVQGIIDQGRTDAEAVRQEMLDKAKEEAAAERNRALQDIDTATNAALQELAEKSADLAVDLAGKIVRAELKPADHSKLIERTMSDFGSEPPSSN